jgi:nicotine blue oxidoreductase
VSRLTEVSHMTDLKVASVLLAAGGGTRFAATARVAGLTAPHKLLAPLANSGTRTIVEHAYASMAEGSPTGAPLLVVSGAVALPPLPGAVLLPNVRWAEGQASSLWTALRAAQEVGCDGVVVGLGDQPFVAPEDWAALHAAARLGAVIAVATYGAKRRNPVYLHKDVWALVPTSGDEGARSVLAENPDLVVQVACSGSPADIDTAEDLLRWS